MRDRGERERERERERREIERWYVSEWPYLLDMLLKYYK